MVPNIEELLPDVESPLQLGVLENIVEVIVRSVNLRLFVMFVMFFTPLNDILILLCSMNRMWVTSLVTACALA